MILLGGAAPSFNQGKGSLQEIEQVDLFHRIAKWGTVACVNVMLDPEAPVKAGAMGYAV